MTFLPFLFRTRRQDASCRFQNYRKYEPREKPKQIRVAYVDFPTKNLVFLWREQLQYNSNSKALIFTFI